MDVLDGVLDGDDMFSLGVVDVVDHAGHGGGLAFASGAGDEDESFSGVGHPGYDFGDTYFVERHWFAGQQSDDGSDFAVVVAYIDSISFVLGIGHHEVEVEVSFEGFSMFVGEHGVGEVFCHA